MKVRDVQIDMSGRFGQRLLEVPEEVFLERVPRPDAVHWLRPSRFAAAGQLASRN